MLIIATIIGALIGGAILGLIPFFLARHFGKPGLGSFALMCCSLSGIISQWFAPTAWIVCICFVISIFVVKGDFHWQAGTQSKQQQQQQQQQYSGGNASSGLNIVCLSGPIRGQSYTLTQNGLLIGRDTSCGVRFPANTPGVSRQHCAIRFQQGVPVLIDLNSTHGTYLGNGQKLPPQYPVELAAGTRFYLGDTSNLFQVTVQ